MSTATKPLSMTQILVCGAAVVTMSMGIRHGFGLWLQPITIERGWNRETFAFALAVQNLVWGLAGPFAGAIADRWGAFRVLVVGSLLYAAGLVTMGLATTGAGFLGSAGLLIGMAQAGTTYVIVYGVIGRNVAPERIEPATPQQSMGAALREALGDRNFKLLTAGYFVCGFQLAFIGVHMPSYLKDRGLSPG